MTFFLALTSNSYEEKLSKYHKEECEKSEISGIKYYKTCCVNTFFAEFTIYFKWGFYISLYLIDFKWGFYISLCHIE